MKLYNANKDEVQGYQQAINRYNLLLKDLKKRTNLNIQQREALNALEELSDIANQLEQGVPTWDMEARCFIEDVNKLWNEIH